MQDNASKERLAQVDELLRELRQLRDEFAGLTDMRARERNLDMRWAITRSINVLINYNLNNV